jgi:hypothetical protein
VLSIALLGAMSLVPAAPAAVAATAPCTTPPPVFPIDKVADGQAATGWTVLKGTTPESFTVTLLGVLKDAIAPGRDVILVKASGANIDAIGGMGPGFSGSPVYRNNQLVGSVSYGLGGDAHYGALTPGQDLVNVLTEPTAKVASAQRVQLSRATRTLIARDANVQLSTVSTSLQQLPLPLAVSGASDARMRDVQSKFAHQGVDVVPYRASSTSSSATVNTSDPIEPGDVFVAAISYGSVSWAAVGTATIRCGDYVVAFGHPFTLNGRGPAGAVLDGNVVTTIPVGTGYWPFKMANIGTLQGVLEQDRLSGVRGVIGKMPALTELSSSITNLDTGAISNATTQVARQNWLPYVAEDHVWSSLFAALDARTGTTEASWTVMIRSQGVNYELALHNAYFGGRALWGPSYDVYSTIRSIERADGPARIVSVHLDATVTEKRLIDVVHHARTASTTSPTFAAQTSIDVHRGDVLSVRVPIVESNTGIVHVAQTTFTIPATATGDGQLEVGSARAYFYTRGSTTLQATIDQLMSQPTAYDLQLQVRLRGTHRMTQYLTQDRPLNGYDAVDLNLIKG